MLDLNFDIVTREIVMKDNDFDTTVNPSVQNGGILLNSRGAFISNPMAGVGLENTINAIATILAREMNRWKAQVLNDGGTICRWNAEFKDPRDPEVTMEVSYL